MSKSLLAFAASITLIGCASLQPRVAVIEVVPVAKPPPTAEPVWYPEPVVRWGNANLRGNGRYYVYGKDAAISVVSRLVELNLGHLNTTIIPHQYENRYRVKIGEFASIPDANHVADWLSTNLQIGSSLIKE